MLQFILALLALAVVVVLAVTLQDASTDKTHPRLLAWLEAARRELPFPLEVASATRSYADQERIYAWGRTAQNPYSKSEEGFPLGRPATNAHGGQSAHQVRADGYSHAIDVAPVPATEANYRAAGAHAVAAGLVWGGSFNVAGKPDLPHVETPHWRTLAVAPKGTS